MFLSELIDPRIRESPTYAPPFSFRLNLPYSDPLLKPNPDGRRYSVTTLLQKPLAGPASIVQNGPARSQITIRDAEVKRAEIGRIRRLHVQVRVWTGGKLCNPSSNGTQREESSDLGLGPGATLQATLCRGRANSVFILVLRWRFIHVVDDEEIDREFFPFQIQPRLAESRY